MQSQPLITENLKTLYNTEYTKHWILEIIQHYRFNPASFRGTMIMFTSPALYHIQADK